MSLLKLKRLHGKKNVMKRINNIMANSNPIDFKKNRLKLRLHLIPSSAFYSNLRKEIGPEKWSNISRKIRGDNNFKCMFCGWKENRSKQEYTHCHEVWKFNKETKVQFLKGFECLCPMCHAVHHWGYSQVRGEDMEALFVHAVYVNKCTIKDFKNHIKKSFKVWRRRSAIKWSLDLNKYSKMVFGK